MYGNNRCIVLLRGHSFRKGTANFNSIEVDFDCARTSIRSLKDQVLEPLRSVYSNINIFCCPSDDHRKEYLISSLSPTLFKNCDGGDQLTSIVNALESIPNKESAWHRPFDAVFFTRLDLLYKKPITEWGFGGDSVVNYPFRHVGWGEGDCHEVPDTMMWINNIDDGYRRFTDQIACLLRNPRCFGHRYGHSLHGIYKLLEGAGISQSFAIDTIHRTNTAHPNDPFGKNPFYAHSGRLYHHDDFHSPCFLK